MYGVSMLVVFERGFASFSAEKENTEIHTAPIFSDLKTEAIPPFLRAMAAENKKQCGDTADECERKSPCEREKIEKKG